MDKKPVITEHHVRTCRVILDKTTLERIVTEWAMSQVGFAKFATKIEVRFEDECNGSPPYKVGTRCKVDLTEDQMLLPKAAEHG